jgi:hypothetical protein
MCLICIELAKGAMSVPEARRALGEMRGKLGPHVAEVESKLVESEANAGKPATTPKP